MQAHASPNRKSTRSAPGEALTLMWPVLSNWRWEHGGKGACQSVWCILWRDSFKQAPKVSGFNSWWIFGARRHLVSVHESQQNRNGAVSSASPPSLHFTHGRRSAASVDPSVPPHLAAWWAARWPLLLHLSQGSSPGGSTSPEPPRSWGRACPRPSGRPCWWWGAATAPTPEQPYLKRNSSLRAAPMKIVFQQVPVALFWSLRLKLHF